MLSLCYTALHLSLIHIYTPAARMPQPALETLRAAIPAARSLPLLAGLAQRATREVTIDYLGPKNLALRIEPCP